jgi:hypothetical protein
MIEKESQVELPSSVDISKELAQAQIEMAFECDPSLVIRGDNTIYWDLSARYTEKLQPYRKGEQSDICIYYLRNEQQVLISQLYPEIYGKGQEEDGFPLRIFLDPKMGDSARFYTAKPEIWYDKTFDTILAVEHPRSRVKGLRDRVVSVLMAAERWTRTFIHYQMFLADNREGLDVPIERLSGPKLSNDLLNYHIRTLQMLEEIRDHKRGYRYSNLGGGTLPIYGHEPYISNKVDM